jgi:hypothetical protein
MNMSAEQGHTLGPWEIDDENQICAGNRVIARAVAVIPALEWDANVRLIAAAPELLAECKALLRFYDALPRQHDAGEAAILDRMQAVIAKIEGRWP